MRPSNIDSHRIVNVRRSIQTHQDLDILSREALLLPKVGV